MVEGTVLVSRRRSNSVSEGTVSELQAQLIRAGWLAFPMCSTKLLKVSPTEDCGHPVLSHAAAKAKIRARPRGRALPGEQGD